MSTLIRAVTAYSQQPDRYFDLKDLDWKTQKDLRDELVAQGYWLQQIFVEDTMPIFIGAELRARFEREASDAR
jgi:hypothetical protein